jgi:polysaccharide export outer membrane protein
MRFPILICLLLLLAACGKPCYDYPVMGACEFVTDSYTIRQGKNAILEMEGFCVGDISCEDLDEYKDSIVEDDILNITIFRPTRRDLMDSFAYINNAVGGFRVFHGSIDTPYLPPVHVAGLTLDEAKEKIQNAYREQIHDIEIYISYRDRLLRKVELAGLVGVPHIPVDGRIRLYDVISRAHIAPNANLFMSYVLRDNTQMPIDLYRLMHEGDMSQNIVMRGGDKVFIANPSDATVMVMGEVRSPRPIDVPYGFISLRQALVSVGGIPFTGDKRCIQVIRGDLKCPKIYVLSWEHIIHLPNDSLLLMPGDTVYVSEKPITRWNRFIEQLLPTSAGIQTFYNVYNLPAS